MYAEVAVNVEAPLESTFHYHVPFDLRASVRVGQLVEVEFGRRLAQAVILRFDSDAPVTDTKPLIQIVDPAPVVRDYQIALAEWLSERYLAPLNACVRLMLPPGLSRWSDITLDVNPYWDGAGRLTEAQQEVLSLVRRAGDIRGRQLRRALSAEHRKRWQTTVRQLVNRDILRQGAVLEPPRMRPKKIRNARLLTDPEKIREAVVGLGRASKAADVLNYLATVDDPLPAEAAVLDATGAAEHHLEKLVAQDLITRLPAQQVNTGDAETPVWVEQPAAVGLAVSPRDTLGPILALRGATKYHAILQLLADAGQPVPVSAIYAETGASINHLRQLVKLDLIRLGSEAVWRDPLADRDFVPAQSPALTRDQAAVWEQIRAAMADENGSYQVLLHGVTGSGKTEIYMRAIAQALDRGQQALVLVPEIALTPQTVRRFAARFPGRVGVLHSGLSDGERYDTWRRARLGLLDIIVGARSALFTPFAAPGVIVLDEEHDDSYKQTPPVPPPYYHARDAARALGHATGATVILGSATPDLVTYHEAQRGELVLLELPKRVMGHRRRIEGQAARYGREAAYTAEEEEAFSLPLPPVDVVDLRQELRAGNRSIFSRALQRAIDDVLERDEQAILFLNRRGTNTFVICRDCGHIMRCPRCDTPLTYHRPHVALTCHQCGYSEPQQNSCPSCGSRRVRYFGLGTEALEEQVQQRWPSARIVRWDRDTTAGRDAHDQLLAAFVKNEADILVGTQMIAKGLDLPLVTLVGVISADVALGLPDFRTGERLFQNLMQVAGRAGRGILGGRVILQTYKPEHYAIQAAAAHDYTEFYLEEIRFRTQHGLPPFRRQARCVFADPVSARAEAAARELARALKVVVHEQRRRSAAILGPVPPYFARINRRYRWQVIVRSADPAAILRQVTIPRTCTVEIDPVSLL